LSIYFNPIAHSAQFLCAGAGPPATSIAGCLKSTYVESRESCKGVRTCVTPLFTLIVLLW